MDYQQLTYTFDKLPTDLFKQTYGSHADEHETSLMLHIAPEKVYRLILWIQRSISYTCGSSTPIARNDFASSSK
jgi:creatinine amidohydrolase/Fe(II)-dependent formamide hydrolase-like protein